MRIAAINFLESSGNVTLSGNWTSSPIYIGHLAVFSIYTAFTGVPEGSFKLQYSNDSNEPTQGARLPENWGDIGSSSQTVDEAGTHGWQVENAGYRWIRVVYTYTAGVGILTKAQFHGKGS